MRVSYGLCGILIVDGDVPTVADYLEQHQAMRMHDEQHQAMRMLTSSTRQCAC